MVPKKSSEFIKPTAKLTEVSEQLVQDITSFYWKDIRKALVDLKFPRINVEGLGTFYAKSSKIPDIELKYSNYVNKFKSFQEKDQMTFQRFAILKDIETKLAKVENLKVMLKQEADKKQAVKDKRYGNKANLDTPETDI